MNVPLFRSEAPALSCSSSLALLDRLAKVIIGGFARGILTRPGPSSLVLVTKVGIANWRSGGHPIPHVSSRPPLFPEPTLVRKKVGDVFSFLTNVCALILAILVDILKLLQRLDNIKIVTEIYDDVLRAGVQTVIKDSQRFENVPPVLPFVVESFIQNFHNLDEIILVISHLGYLVHLGARGSPRVVGGGVANLCLDIRVTLRVVFGDTESAFAKVLYGHDDNGE